MNEFRCRICGFGGASSVFETMTTLAANVSDEPDVGMERYPIQVVRCERCGHIQLKGTFDETLYSEYLYTPSFASGFTDPEFPTIF